jgi:hypothetical protein
MLDERREQVVDAGNDFRLALNFYFIAPADDFRPRKGRGQLANVLIVRAQEIDQGHVFEDNDFFDQVGREGERGGVTKNNPFSP